MIVLPLLVVAAVIPLWLERGLLAREVAADAARRAAIEEDPEVLAEYVDVLRSRLESAGTTAGCPAPASCAALEVAGDRGGPVAATVRMRMPSLGLPFSGSFEASWFEARAVTAADPYPNPP